MLIKAYFDLSRMLRLLEGAGHWGKRREDGAVEADARQLNCLHA